MIGLGSIIDGPTPQSIATLVEDAYAHFLNMINDPVPKVRQTVAFVYYKLSEYVPEIILRNKENLDLFINNSLNNLDQSPLISTLLIGGVKNIFQQTCIRGQSSILNEYLPNVFTKLFEQLYSQKIHQANELQSVSDAINDVCDFCDSQPPMQQALYDYLAGVLQELAHSTDPGSF